MEWINKMYSDAKEKHKSMKLQNGMAIYYTPIVEKPSLLLIRDNPDGEKDKIWNSVPTSYDYFPNDEKDDYEMAKKMRQIFSTTEHYKVPPEVFKPIVSSHLMATVFHKQFSFR